MTLSAIANSSAEKLDMLDRAQEKDGKRKDLMRPTKPTIVEMDGTAPVTSEVIPSEPQMLHAVNLPANRKKMF